MLDYIVVGQGIAGSLLSWSLLKAGQSVMVIDAYNANSASNIASGVTNPITGKKFVKTWLADTIIPYAEQTYLQLEQELNTTFYNRLSILKLLDSVKAQNDWSARCALPEYLPYLQNEAIIYLDKEKVNNEFGSFEINGGSRLNTTKFLTHYRNFLKAKSSLLEEHFDYANLQHTSDFITYKGHQAKAIIFCEGAHAIYNPYFNYLPFQLAKGQCLSIKTPTFYPDKMINGEVFISPNSTADEYYIGATHEWNFTDSLPSPEGKKELVKNLSTLLTAPYEIIEHKSAIRPTVKDRRPFVGFHPKHSNIGIFNGMGTKGISLSPYFANHFTEHLVAQKPLLKEVDISRFL